MADGADAQGPDGGGGPGMESDFSLRKIRTATVCLIGMTFATSILPYSALGFVLLPMTAEFGWTREQFNYAGSFLMAFGALTVWVMGRMTDKIGARPIILLGTIGVGLVTLSLSQVQSLWQFCALFALVGVFGSSGASYSKVIAALFTQNRGKAMAVFGAEGAAVRFFIPMITIFLITHYDWRGMFVAFGIAILACVPVLYFGLDEPGTVGRLPKLRLRRKAQAEAAAPPPRMDFEGKTTGQVMRDWVFWLMLVATLPSAVIGNGILVNQFAAIVDKGFSQEMAAYVTSVGVLFGVGGTLLGGWMMDRFQTAKVSIPFSLVTALGYFLLMIVMPRSGGQPMLLAAVGLGAFAFSAALPMGAFFLTRYFGLKSFAEVTGVQATIQALCFVFAGPLVGRIHDRTDSYDLAFQIGIGAALFAAAMFLVLPAYRFSANIGAMPAPPKPVR